MALDFTVNSSNHPTEKNHLESLAESDIIIDLNECFCCAKLRAKCPNKIDKIQ